MSESLLLTAIVPHPPIIIPEVGGSELKNVDKTVKALEQLSEKITELNPETIVIITPHSVFNPYKFSVYTSETLSGSFERFRAPHVSLEFENDLVFIEGLAGVYSIPASTLLDHGSLVPLYYLGKSGYNGKVVVINYTALGKEEHKLFGQYITETAQGLGRKTVLIASGDLSHKLIPGAPAGYDSNAHEFDDLIIESIKSGDYSKIEAITADMRDTAGECGYNSLMVALGAIGSEPQQNEVLSYEAPFGVGYVVGIL